jgi:hypothetical protein
MENVNFFDVNLTSRLHLHNLSFYKRTDAHQPLIITSILHSNQINLYTLSPLLFQTKSVSFARGESLSPRYYTTYELLLTTFSYQPKYHNGFLPARLRPHHRRHEGQLPGRRRG